MTIQRACLMATMLTTLLACGPARPPDISESHLSKNDVPPEADTIPAPVNTTTLLPKPISRPALETYTVVVNDVPIKELLFSMARDAKLNVDIAPDLTGNVTLNAIDQTLPQILERISRQTD
ncbi:MAG TPA: type II and III secretion system protein, partial [Gammaproteobacteria bacterium]|nr:type II and III secretion system protein [Gammaproteobacteria bacterium]